MELREEKLTTTVEATAASSSSSDLRTGSLSPAASTLGEDQRQQQPNQDEVSIRLRSLLQIAGSFCLSINTWGLLNSYGAFQAYYSFELLSHHSASQISWIGSVQAFLFLESSLLVGPLFDAGYLRSLLAVGLVLSTFGMFMTSLCSELWQLFLAQGVCMGIGFGCLFLPGPALISQHFQKHRSFAMGIAMSGVGVGGIIFPLILSRLEPILGFGWATRVIGFVMLVTLTVPLAVMQYPKRVATSPMSTETKEAINEPSIWSQIVNKIADPSIWKDGPYLWLQVGYIFGYMGLYSVLYYITLFSTNKIVQSSSTFTYDGLIILNAASIVGRLVLSRLADMVGPVNVMITTSLVSALLVFLLIIVDNVRGLIVWVVIFGFNSSAFTNLTAPGIVSVSNMGVAKVGARFGASFAIVGLFILVAEPVAGAVLAAAAGWTGLIIWCGVLLVLGAVGLAAARLSKAGSALVLRI